MKLFEQPTFWCRGEATVFLRHLAFSSQKLASSRTLRHNFSIGFGGSQIYAIDLFCVLSVNLGKDTTGGMNLDNV